MLNNEFEIISFYYTGETFVFHFWIIDLLKILSEFWMCELLIVPKRVDKILIKDFAIPSDNGSGNVNIYSTHNNKIMELLNDKKKTTYE